MLKLDFQRFSLFTGIDKKTCVVVDIRKDFADAIYQMGSGIAAHALALKIYQSQGLTDYSFEEIELMRVYASHLSPAFIDSFKRLVAPQP